MTKRSTKTSLLLSCLALLLCFSMLIGTTFAWFTDSVASDGNIIKTGTLDVEMMWADGDEDLATANWQDASKGAIFNSTLWEPGRTEARHLNIINKGSLALKYALTIEPNGDVSKLADVIDVYFIEGGKQLTRDTLKSYTPDGTLADLINNGIARGNLAAGANRLFTIVLKMQETAGNEYQDKAIGADFKIKLIATQYTAEEDSFDEFYDAGAPWLGEANTAWYEADPTATEFTIMTSEELAGLAKIVNSGTDTFAGNTIKLGSDLDLNDLNWVPVGIGGGWEKTFNGSFDGNGHTISNLNVKGTAGVGLFGHVGNSAHFEDLTIDTAYVAGNDYVGALVGTGYLAENCIKNCTVKNAEIIAIPYLMADGVTYDGGAKAGAIAGFVSNGNLSGNKVINCSVSAYRDLGGIAGMVSGENRHVTVSDNSVEKLNLTYFDLEGAPYESSKPNQNMGNIVGRIKNTTVGTNTEADVTRTTKITYTENGVQYIEYMDDEIVYLYLVTDQCKSETLNVPEGVTNIGNYAFAYNNTVKNVVLPTTVTDLGRGFDSSTVEKVVLNEGLETISSRAFRRTDNLKEVVISSTVTTIADNAFQSTGIKNIVIPASVNYIGDSCFTASDIETVTIEGKDVTIEHYAFRDTALKTVVILSDTVTLGSGMIFTNNQHNNDNPNGITIYVKNEAVKGAIEANGTFKGTIVILGETVEDNDDLSGALTEGADTVYVPEGTYTFPSSKLSAGDTLICAEGTVFEGANSLNVKGATVMGGTFSNSSGNAVSGTVNGTFKGCTFTGYNGLRGCYAGETVVFEDCVFDGSVYGIHFDGGENDAIFRNCTFSGFNAMGSALTKLTMENCTFVANGKSGYNGINLWGSTEMKNCTFVFDGTATEWVDLMGDNKTVTFTGCVVSDGTTERALTASDVGDYGTGNTIIIDGAYLVDTSAELKAVAAANATVYLQENDVVYDLNGAQHDGLKIIGLGEGVQVVNNTKYASGKTIGAIWKAIHLENVTLTNTVYTMADGGNATFTNVNFAAGVREAYGTGVVFTDCTFGSNSEGYALHFQTNGSSTNAIQLNDCELEGGKVHLGSGRTYVFTNCDFAAGTDFQVWADITLEGCTVDGEVITAENIATFFPNLNTAKVTLK